MVILSFSFVVAFVVSHWKTGSAMEQVLGLVGHSTPFRCGALGFGRRFARFGARGKSAKMGVYDAMNVVVGCTACFSFV